MLVARDEICTLIPQSGRMCLFDGVQGWDTEAILCLSSTHLTSDNPLRKRGRLAAVHGLEYGAQAAAVHGRLLMRASGSRAYLAAFKDARLLVDRLDTIPPLEVIAQRLTAWSGNQMYATHVSVSERVLVSARDARATPRKSRHWSRS